MFPPLSARSSGAAESKRKPLADPAGHSEQQVSEWTPHDVAEWLYLLVSQRPCLACARHCGLSFVARIAA